MNMNRLTRLALSIMLLCVLFIPEFAGAEIICDCGKTACSCFIQMGDEGIAVDGVIDLLAEQGYLSSSRGSTFDSGVHEAVCAFQRDHGLTQSGMLTDETLTMLIWGESSYEEGVTVWVPTDGGKKRHDKPTCSNMHDPRKMSSVNAQKLGIEACKRCKPE